jgi:LDH2 family malate/lactate/ureidoglycolate dehydrogenase
MDLSPRDKRTQKGVEFIRITVPSERAAQLRKLAADEGITVQGLVAPVLNSLAKQELRREYVMPAQPSSDPMRPR